jgi:hypothetical protein
VAVLATDARGTGGPRPFPPIWLRIIRNNINI